MAHKDRIQDILAYKIINISQPTFRARLMDKLPFYVKADFCEGVQCYVSSVRELKRSRQTLSPKILKWIKSFESQDVFYDIGANVGAFSLTAAKLHEKKITTYAFEPAFATFGTLVRNILINNFEDVVFPYAIALGDNSGWRTFNYSNLASGEAVHSLDLAENQRGASFSPVFKQQVLSYSLDDLVQNHSFPMPVHIKIDVDGGEGDVLEGMKQSLFQSSIKSVLVEITDDEKNEKSKKIKDLFERANFVLSDIIPHKSHLIYDCLFTKNWIVK